MDTNKEKEFINNLNTKDLKEQEKLLENIKKLHLDINKVIIAIDDKLEASKKLTGEEAEDLKQFEQLLKKNKKELEKIEEIEENIVEETLKQELALKRQETTLVKLKKGWESLSSTANLVSNSLSSVSAINLSKLVPTTLWRDNAKSLIDMEDAAYRMSQRAGKGPEGIKELKNTYIDIQAKLKDSAENAREITKTLSETGYVKNLGEAAEYISLFSRTTGTSIGQTTEVMNGLTKIGKFSSKEAGTIIANVARIQKLNGITVEGMNAWASSVKSVTNNMKAFGQSDESIKKMVVSTAKLVSSLEKVGVSAQQATQWIERLTDPDNIEKNIGLYAQLGISISDALSGNIDGDTIGAGLKDFGQKIKEMGPIAGKAYADAFGISYKEAIKAADMETAIDTGEITEQDSKSELEKMKEETLSFNQMQKENINQMIGETQKLMGNLTQKQLMLISIGVSYVMSSIPKIFNKMIDNQKEFDRNRVFKEEEYQAMVIAGDEEGLKKLLEGTIRYYDTLEKLEEKAADNPKLKQQIEEARDLKDILVGKLDELKSGEVAQSLQNQLNNGMKNLYDDFKNKMEGVNFPNIKFDDDFDTNIKSIKGAIEEAQEKINNAFENTQESAKNAITNALETMKEKVGSIELPKIGFDEGYEKTLEDITKASDKLNEDITNLGKQLAEELDEERKKTLENQKKAAELVLEEIKKAGTELKEGADNFKIATGKLRENTKKLSEELKEGVKEASSSLKNSSKRLKRDISAGAKTAGKYLELSSKRAAKNLKAGAIAAKIPLATIGIGLYRAADKMWGITDKIANWLKSLGGFGKFIGSFFDLDMDDNKEAVEKNTEELSKNNEFQEENKPSQIYIDKNTKDVAVKSGIKSVGDITNEETKATTSINKTTNASSGNNSTDRSSEIVNALQEQIRIAARNGSSVEEIAKLIREINNKPINQIAAATNTEPAGFVDSSNEMA